MKVGLLLTVVFLIVNFVYCEPQIKPFLYTISPSTLNDQKVTIHFDACGYIFRPTFNDRSSVADRFFGSNRMAIQISFGREF